MKILNIFGWILVVVLCLSIFGAAYSKPIPVPTKPKVENASVSIVKVCIDHGVWYMVITVSGGTIKTSGLSYANVRCSQNDGVIRGAIK